MQIDKKKKNKSRKSKKPWIDFKFVCLGQVGKIVKGGGGKLTPSPADPGEGRKPPGMAPE